MLYLYLVGSMDLEPKGKEGQFEPLLLGKAVISKWKLTSCRQAKAEKN